MADFRLVDYGSYYQLTPQTQKADEWIREFLPYDLYDVGGSINLDAYRVSVVVAKIIKSGNLTIE